MIDFLDELGNFKQKNFTLQNVKFYILKCQGRTTQPKKWKSTTITTHLKKEAQESQELGVEHKPKARSLQNIKSPL